ncbi:DUF6992 family protein [Hymenobacter puniceus]|uniref:DUF6992 family protein n=1 Tax=Hymenobacter sp. BT190 TaxID=2763505 RepID=UPI00165189E2|nr:hypothetical protein [Hymenobacter sp. BT190]MBC6699844.1 hypothetical protein [Hymenobacter sp. BT190]
MLPRLSLLALGLLAANSLAAQPLPSSKYTVFQDQRTTLDRRGMRVLGGWALSNVGLSGARYFATEGHEKYFHQMNVGWGVVNLALAGTTLLAGRRPTDTPDRPTLVRTQLRTENLYLFNAGLDVAYLATGLYLRERATSRPTVRRQQQLRGYGQSLLLQGGFLLAFDGLMFAAHHRHASGQLYPLLSGLQVGPGTVAVTLPIR